MPIYEYACSCGHRFEELLRSPDEGVLCPACGRGDVPRLLSAFVAGGDRRPRADFSTVPFERATCCGGSCRRHRH